MDKNIACPCDHPLFSQFWHCTWTYSYTFLYDIWTLSHPVPDPMTDPRHWTLSDPDQICRTFWTSVQTFYSTYPYLLIPFTSSSEPTPDSACPRTSTPLHSIILFILSPYLPYSYLPACICFLVPDSNSCPYSLDSDRTSYTDPLL